MPKLYSCIDEDVAVELRIDSRCVITIRVYLGIEIE